MHSLRRSKLRFVLDTLYGGNRGKLLQKAGMSRGRLSQLLDVDKPFGERAARNLEARLELPDNYFDTMDAQTVEFALMFESLPQAAKDKWLQLVQMLGSNGGGG